MNLFENLLNMAETDSKVKMEAGDHELWSTFVNIYNGFVPIKDLANYFDLDRFGEFVQWCRHEADIDYDYEKRYDNWDEAFKDLDEATGAAESISLENIFNFFSTSDLEDFLTWVEKEYDLDSGYVYESKKSTLREYNSNINNKDQLYNEMLRYTEEPLVSFTDLFNCYSTDDLQYLYDYLSSEYEDDEFPVYRGKINNKDEMWNAMNELILPNEQQIGFDDLFNCYSLDKLKDLYDFLSSEYSYLDDYDEEFESKQLNESNNIVDDRKRMEYIVDIVNSLDDHLNTVDEISESLSKKIGKLYKMCSFLESIDEIKESTSGISGAYTTKSLDIKPE